MTLRLYQAGLQIVCKNVTAKYNLLQTGLQVVVRRKNPVYNLYQGGIQTALRRLDMPQHAQYSFYDLPLEVVYEPAPETVQFSHCLEAGYFFAVDHFGELTGGGTLTVRVYGGVPPYTWSLDIGSVLALSDTETDDPFVTLSISGAFAVGTEELTVEDACGSQATVCIYLCTGYSASSYTCTTEFSCSEHCRRAVVPVEPPTPPPPVPPIPPSPPEPPLAPHETEVLTAVLGQSLAGLEFLVVSFYNEPDNIEVRLLWDLNTMAPLAASAGPAFVNRSEYDSRYGYLGEPAWINDLLVVGESAALPTINKQNYDGKPELDCTDFGYEVTEDQEWGCGNTFTRADFVPLWCEDTETICYGMCGGVNWSDDFFEDCHLMPPWDEAEIIRSCRSFSLNNCTDFSIHDWGDVGGPLSNTYYNYKFVGVQKYSGFIYFDVRELTCAPWSYAKLHEQLVEIDKTRANITLLAVDLALGANEDHGYIRSRGPSYTDPGDWGSVSLVPGEDPFFMSYGSFVRTAMRFAGTYYQSGGPELLWDTSDGCQAFSSGTLGGKGNWSIGSEQWRYEYFTHFGRIALYYPERGMARADFAGHRKLKVVANEKLQCQIFLFQRTESATYLSSGFARKGDFHAALETGELKSVEPYHLPRREAFELALNRLFDLYYTENDYDFGTGLIPETGSKIDPSLEIRVGVVSFSSRFHLYELPLEVVYERS